ncbi:hypothetical protein MEQU1_003523 [Malassezia equina]|uniref:FHA domain-containing protein n=1 Tax=Malassezia equina TaxID=1381935 RepID=A0AAF0J1T9_9BASI|nr:hypothetical protein MEQU1_003523 [Malassezia equina]
MFVFKDGKEMVVDIPTEHPSCSKQHAVIQFRQVTKRNEFGDVQRSVKYDIRTTERVLANMRKEIEDVTQDLDGFEDLEAADQEKVLAAFALGHVREEDKTPALADNEEARASQESHKPTHPRPRKRKAAHKEDEEEPYTTPHDDNDDEDEPERPDFLDELPSKRTRKRTERFGMSQPSRQAKRKAASDDENKDEDEEEEEGEEEEEEEEEEDSDDSDAFRASDTGDEEDDFDDDE